MYIQFKNYDKYDKLSESKDIFKLLTQSDKQSK